MKITQPMKREIEAAVPDVQTLISKLDLEPHPEGGFFKRTIVTGDAASGRLVSTCIYYLLTQDSMSSLHKVDVDEYWLYHTGTSDIVIKGFPASGESAAFAVQMGNACMRWQHLIPKETWFGAKVLNAPKDAYALISCICAPGFDFSGFSLGSRNSLIMTYPQHIRLIEEMCVK